MSNPMESEDFVMTHVFEDSYTKKIYAITLRGPFLRTSREAKEGIARTVDIPYTRLQGLCHVELGKVVTLFQMVRSSHDVTDLK